MKLLSLHVENFGKLHDYSDSFTDGINQRMQNNGWGKSSLAVFIKAMFYGLPVTTKQSVIENERRRYTPWQGGTFGGSLDFSWQGGTYRIERTFGKTASDDTLTVTDLSTGRAAETPWANDPGCGIFGVDAAAYERSTYLSQHPTDARSGAASIGAKLNCLVEATDDIANFDTAIDAIDKRRRYYKHAYDDGGGVIPAMEEELFGLGKTIERLREERGALADLSAEIVRLKAEKEVSDAKLAELTETEARATSAKAALADRNYYDNLCADLASVTDNINGLRRELNGHIPDEETVGKLSSLAGEQTKLESALALCRLTDDEERSLADLSAIFPEGTPDEGAQALLREHAATLFRAYGHYENVREISSAEKTYAALRADFPEAALRDDVLPSLLSDCRVAAKTRQDAEGLRAGIDAMPPVGRPLVFLALLFLTVLFGGLIFTGFAVMPLFFVFGGLAATSGIGALVAGLLHRKKKNALRSERSRLEDEYRNAKAALDAIRADLEARLSPLSLTLPDDPAEAIPALDALAGQRLRLSVLEEEIREICAGRDAAEKELSTVSERFAALYRLATVEEVPAPDTAIVCVETLIRDAGRLNAMRKHADQIALEADALRKAQADLRETLVELTAPYPACAERSPADAAKYLTERRLELLTLAKRAEEKKTAADAFFESHAMGTPEFAGKLRLAREVDSEALAAARAGLQDTVNRLSSLILEKEHRASVMTEEVAAIDEDENRECELSEQLARAKINLETLISADKYLKLARKNLSQRYLATMRERFGAYLSLLKESAWDSYTMDDDLAVKLRESGTEHPTDCFSTGTRDLVALCARLALVDALFEEEEPFLVLDDPFINFDDDTVARAQHLLASLADRRQILYFSCSDSRTARVIFE